MISIWTTHWLANTSSTPWTYKQYILLPNNSGLEALSYFLNKHPVLDPPTRAYVHTTKFFCVLFFFFFHGVCNPFTVSNVLVTPLMKGQAQNVCRGTQTTRKHFCPLFFVEHSFTYRYVIQLNLSQKNNSTCLEDTAERPLFIHRHWPQREVGIVGQG